MSWSTLMLMVFSSHVLAQEALCLKNWLPYRNWCVSPRVASYLSCLETHSDDRRGADQKIAIALSNASGRNPRILAGRNILDRGAEDVLGSTLQQTFPTETVTRCENVWNTSRVERATATVQAVPITPRVKDEAKEFDSPKTPLVNVETKPVESKEKTVFHHSFQKQMENGVNERHGIAPLAKLQSGGGEKFRDTDTLKIVEQKADEALPVERATRSAVTVSHPLSEKVMESINTEAAPKSAVSKVPEESTLPDSSTARINAEAEPAQHSTAIKGHRHKRQVEQTEDRKDELNQYKVTVSANSELKINGAPGELRVWIGQASYSLPVQPDMNSKDQLIETKTTAITARVTPFAPAFNVEPKESICERVDPTGSTVVFYVTPQHRGAFPIGATVALYQSQDCSGVPVPKEAAPVTVRVSVGIAPVLDKAGVDLLQEVWGAFMKFFHEILTVLFTLMLFSFRKKLFVLFGVRKKV